MFYHVPEFGRFQIMMILDPYGMIFDAVGVFGLAFHLLFKSWSTYCGLLSNKSSSVMWFPGTQEF